MVSPLLTGLGLKQLRWNLDDDEFVGKVEEVVGRRLHEVLTGRKLGKEGE